jgi:CelD/BcsL family acetyltransferase involved in cellulose biosynthesis/glycosyltransferase involved in cell wall biosynthesis
VSRRSLCVLSVAFPLAPVGPDAVGGAEQILTHLDAALVRAGHRSVVVAAEGSSPQGVLVPVPRVDGRVSATNQEAVHAATRRVIQRALVRYPVDVMHFHGVDFDRYLPTSGPPALVTLHLPHFSYTSTTFELERPNTFLQPVSSTQQAGLPPACLPVLEPIENGVPLDELYPCGAKQNFALTLGRICPEKGFPLAARAARLAGVPLLLGGQVFGYPTHLAYFRDVLAPLFDDEWFQFVGPLSLERKRQLLGQARCLLIPSQITETSSLVAMEAAACGTPVIAFRAGALGQIVEHGRTGFLVDSIEQMADAIGRVDEIDSCACRRVAQERFSAERMAARYLERYAQVLKGIQSVPPALEVTEVTSRHGLAELRGQWTELWNRCGSSIFQHPDWLIAWCRPFDVHQPWLLAFRRGTRLVGVVPLLIYLRGQERVLTLMGAGISDDQDVLVERVEQASIMHAMWRYLAERAERWDCFELENLRATSPLLGAAPRNWRSEPIVQDDVRPVLDLAQMTRLEDLAARDMLRDVRYQTRRAAREGLPITVETASPQSFERLFDELVRLHRTRWQARGRNGMLTGDLESFHREVAQHLVQHDALRLHVLCLAGRSAAAFYGYHAAGQTIYYLGGFEPSFARFSPGKLVVAHAIEHAITHDHAAAFDFLRGAEPYKYAWGAIDQPLYRRRLSAGVETQHRKEAVHAA